MNSPIAQLTEVLQIVKEAAQSYQSQLQGNEAATRAALVDPVMRTLGWDIANPAKVLVEKTQTVHGTQLRVDYALLADGEISVVVEAKKLGGNLREGFLQLVQYSIGLGIGSIFITDGMRWEHYTSITHENSDPARRWNIAEESLAEIAIYLIQHLDVALVAPEEETLDALTLRLEALEQRVGGLEQQNNLRNTSGSSHPAPPPSAIDTTDNLRDEGWLSLPDIADATDTKPIRVRLPDGTEKSVRAWAHVLSAAGHYVLQNSPILRSEIPLPDAAGRSLHLITKERPPLHRRASAVTIGDETFFVCTNYSANAVITNIKHLWGAAHCSTPIQIQIAGH